MADYWKSAPKHYCEICKTWISGHPRNIKTHEASEKHEFKRQQKLRNLEIAAREKAKAEKESLDQIHRLQTASLQLDEPSDRGPVELVPMNSEGVWGPCMGPVQAPVVNPFLRQQAEKVDFSAYAPAAKPAFMNFGKSPPPPDFPRDLTLQRSVKRQKINLPPPVPLAGPLSDTSEEHLLIDIQQSAIPAAPLPLFLVSEKPPTTYPSADEVPGSITSLPEFSDPTLWTRKIDMYTAIPIYTNSKLNIACWSAPDCFDESAIKSDEESSVARSGRLSNDTSFNYTKPPPPPPEVLEVNELKTESNDDSNNKEPSQIPAEAGQPGEWEEVQSESESAFGVPADAVGDTEGEDWRPADRVNEEAVSKNDQILDQLKIPSDSSTSISKERRVSGDFNSLDQVEKYLTEFKGEMSIFERLSIRKTLAEFDSSGSLAASDLAPDFESQRTSVAQQKSTLSTSSGTKTAFRKRKLPK